MTNPLDVLSPGERDVLAAMAGGFTNEAISSRLFISKRTVEKRSSNVFVKLDCTGNASFNPRVVAVLKFLENDQ